MVFSPELHDVLLLQATGVHNMDNCVELGKNSRGHKLVPRAVGVLNNTSQSSG